MSYLLDERIPGPRQAFYHGRVFCRFRCCLCSDVCWKSCLIILLAVNGWWNPEARQPVRVSQVILMSGIEADRHPYPVENDPTLTAGVSVRSFYGVQASEGHPVSMSRSCSGSLHSVLSISIYINLSISTSEVSIQHW